MKRLDILKRTCILKEEEKNIKQGPVNTLPSVSQNVEQVPLVGSRDITGGT